MKTADVLKLLDNAPMCDSCRFARGEASSTIRELRLQRDQARSDSSWCLDKAIADARSERDSLRAELQRANDVFQYQIGNKRQECEGLRTELEIAAERNEEQALMLAGLRAEIAKCKITDGHGNDITHLVGEKL